MTCHTPKSNVFNIDTTFNCLFKHKQKKISADLFNANSGIFFSPSHKERLFL